jgi:hypothetical protein
MNEEHLRTYLDDHHAGSLAAVELIEHYIETHDATPRSAFLRELLGEIREDQGVLLDLLRRVGGKQSSLKDAAAWLLDKLSRTKLNEMTKHRTLSEFEKLEELVLGVTGKLRLWVVLRAVTASDGRFADIDFDRLEHRAHEQIERLEEQRLEAARVAFLEAGDTTSR